jgi:cellulose synthase/poly-beta-1,6-N-acetylglucosamine synthase-like glycosyltransferase
METLLYNLWIGVQILLGVHLIVPIVFYFISSVFPFVRKKKQHDPIVEADYGIIVTAYGQLDGVEHVLDSLLKLQYAHYHVYVVADNCDKNTPWTYEHDKVTILWPEKVLASNTRSHFYAIAHFHRAHERLTIIDSDNLVKADYLNALNVYFDQGFHAVQGVREAKNIDTPLACLDAGRDIYYHYYDGKLLFKLGSSATLAGSGMAFTVDVYKECLGHLDIEGAGFDKVLQFELVQRKYRIAFAEEAKVYDEKTTQAQQLVKQRARWINTWFKYFKFGFALMGKGFFQLNWNQFLFGFILLRPPLFMFILGSGLCMFLSIWIGGWLHVGLWAIAFILFGLGFLIALLKSNAPKEIYRALWRIPMFMYYQILSLIKSKRANQISVATQHSVKRKIEDMKN